MAHGSLSGVLDEMWHRYIFYLLYIKVSASFSYVRLRCIVSDIVQQTTIPQSILHFSWPSARRTDSYSALYASISWVIGDGHLHVVISGVLTMPTSKHTWTGGPSSYRHLLTACVEPSFAYTIHRAPGYLINIKMCLVLILILTLFRTSKSLHKN